MTKANTMSCMPNPCSKNALHLVRKIWGRRYNHAFGMVLPPHLLQVGERFCFQPQVRAGGNDKSYCGTTSKAADTIMSFYHDLGFPVMTVDCQ